ncbi:hypothetical protein [Spiroplasma endosymbiont of Labia minor]|uniref:hypothetical protein n=1 Tax=Spiroplasma endosymbiont of Labia minor TaxID=3066305 RepID=UPI0030CB1B37
MKTNFKQTSDSNCGISVITTAINHLTSRNFSLNDIIIDNELSDHWFSFEEIKEIVERYDIYTVGYKSNFREIIDWNKNNGYILLPQMKSVNPIMYIYLKKINLQKNLKLQIRQINSLFEC